MMTTEPRHYTAYMQRNRVGRTHLPEILLADYAAMNELKLGPG